MGRVPGTGWIVLVLALTLLAIPAVARVDRTLADPAQPPSCRAMHSHPWSRFASRADSTRSPSL
jgi:hypothetical protein